MTTQNTTAKETTTSEKFQKLSEMAIQIVTLFTSNHLTKEYHKYAKAILGTFLSVPDEEKEEVIPLFFKATESLFELLQTPLPSTFGTYLQGAFSLDKVKSIQNSTLKPLGGLWACPYDSENGNKTKWYDFHEMNLSQKSLQDRTLYKFMFQSEANIFVIHSQMDLFVLFRAYGSHMDIMQQICVQAKIPLTDHYLNFEAITSDFDAILVTEKAIQELSQPQIGKAFNLYSWDVESLLVLNPKAMSRPWV